MVYDTLHVVHSDEKRRIIIGAPLVLVAVFCFGMFILQPTRSVGTQSSASATSAAPHKKASETSKDDKLARLPLMRTDLTKLSPAAPTGQLSNSGSVGDDTASPQTTGGSSAPGSSGSVRFSGNGTGGSIPVKSSKPNDNGSLQGTINDLLR